MLKPDSKLGFENGQPVLVQWPADSETDDGALAADDAARLRRETVCRFLSWITASNADAETIGRRALILSYELHLQTAPQNLSELATRLGVSKTRAWQISQALKLNGETGAFSGDFEENEAAD